jgi:serine/threonine protein kinase
MAEHLERRLGNYSLTRLTGTSAFADVYLGTHIYLSTHVAIKVLRALLKEQAFEGFLIGARDLTHLVHPHINRVFDVGSDNNTPFLVMDYAPNGNVRLPPPLAAQCPSLGCSPWSQPSLRPSSMRTTNTSSTWI